MKHREKTTSEADEPPTAIAPNWLGASRSSEYDVDSGRRVLRRHGMAKTAVQPAGDGRQLGEMSVCAVTESTRRTTFPLRFGRPFVGYAL
jgi:hypothetical protein